MAYTTVNKSTDHHFTTLWSGTNAGETISGIPFQPDLNWTKQRTGTQDHVIVDAVRGVQKTFFTNEGDAEYTLADGTEGQIKIISMKVDGGNATVTPDNFVNGTSILFNATNDTITLLYQSTGWVILARQNATVS